MLNKSKPYDTVYGVPGIGFVQDGKSFRPDGEQVNSVRAKVRNDSGDLVEIEMAEDMVSQMSAEKIPEKVVAPEPPKEVPPEKEEPEIPEFITKPPVKKKYPSQMNVQELTAELLELDIPFPKDAKRADLLKILQKRR